MWKILSLYCKSFISMYCGLGQQKKRSLRSTKIVRGNSMKNGKETYHNLRESDPTKTESVLYYQNCRCDDHILSENHPGTLFMGCGISQMFGRVREEGWREKTKKGWWLNLRHSPALFIVAPAPKASQWFRKRVWQCEKEGFWSAWLFTTDTAHPLQMDLYRLTLVGGKIIVYWEWMWRFYDMFNILNNLLYITIYMLRVALCTHLSTQKPFYCIIM